MNKRIAVNLNMSVLSIDLDQTFTTGVVNKLYEKKEHAETLAEGVMITDAEKRAYSDRVLFNTSMVMANADIYRLVFKRVWERSDTQEYADLYVLIHQGIPRDMRIQMWKELLMAQIAEF